VLTARRADPAPRAVGLHPPDIVVDSILEACRQRGRVGYVDDRRYPLSRSLRFEANRACILEERHIGDITWETVEPHDADLRPVECCALVIPCTPEGALKPKEISYIHAEAYEAGDGLRRAQSLPANVPRTRVPLHNIYSRVH